MDDLEWGDPGLGGPGMEDGRWCPAGRQRPHYDTDSAPLSVDLSQFTVFPMEQPNPSMKDTLLTASIRGRARPVPAHSAQASHGRIPL